MPSEQETILRKTVLPKYNLDKNLIDIDGFVDHVKKLDPKKEDDSFWLHQGYMFEAKVSFPESLGEQGGWTEFHYKTEPTTDEVVSDLVQSYLEFIEEVNQPVDGWGTVAKSGRDEQIESKMREALERYERGKSKS